LNEIDASLKGFVEIVSMEIIEGAMRMNRTDATLGRFEILKKRSWKRTNQFQKFLIGVSYSQSSW